jgi:predicted nucleotidyltransferase
VTTTNADVLDRLPVSVPTQEIEQFCAQHHVKEVALFGSVLRDDFGPESDIDVLVTFEPSARPTLLTLARMEEELERIFKRRVDLLERAGLDQCSNPYIRTPVISSLRVIYAR